MKYKCRPCGWHGAEDEATWARQYVNSEAWGVVKGQSSEYATCPDCGNEVYEVDTKEPDELILTLADIARAGAGV